MNKDADFSTGDVALKFEDDDAKIQNTVYQTVPIVIHGNGPSKVLLNSLGNYLAKSWTQNEGCLSCQEGQLELKNVLVREPDALFCETDLGTFQVYMITSTFFPSLQRVLAIGGPFVFLTLLLDFTFSK